ncbi:MAG: class I SAM-dependent methyltransferase [Ruminococcaceae bacterium]|nr:class I SAM-dependent methyltransferase [Oscillospiraceae bacterium]
MSFSTLADFYDSINGSAYEPYADFLEKSFKLSTIPVKEVLDLGCGTGGICAILADRGFDMVGVDISTDMLMVARERNLGKNTLLLCQDMCEFELYGTVQAVYSSFDCLNYITENKGLKQVFVLVRNYLESGGVFVFDINTEFRYTQILDGKSFVYETDDNLAVWRSAFDKEEKLCEFEIDNFTKLSGNKYIRESETQIQRLYTHQEIMDFAEGFDLVEQSGGKGFDGCDEAEKTYYVFRKR